MNDRTVEIEVTIDMFAISPTHGAYIRIDSITNTMIFGKLSTLTTLLHYNNMKLQDVSCFMGNSGAYFNNILNI